MKHLTFVGSSLDDIRDFPAEARRQAGFELDGIQTLVQVFVRSESMSWASGASSMWPDLQKLSMCSTPSRRRVRKRGAKISIWPAGATVR
jgi:phage-related protein